MERRLRGIQGEFAISVPEEGRKPDLGMELLNIELLAAISQKRNMFCVRN